VIIVAEPDQVDADLTGGRLPCPRCGGRLQPWAHTTTRRVRQLDGSTQTVRPRRAHCTTCRTTHILLPGNLLPRRADTAEVIGAALLAKTHGHGWRLIAADLGRPPATGRRWLRAARGAHLAWLRNRACRTPPCWTATSWRSWPRSPPTWPSPRWAPPWQPGAAGSPDTPSHTLIGVCTGGWLLTPI
jgi:hypothetical protein